LAGIEGPHQLISEIEYELNIRAAEFKGFSGPLIFESPPGPFLNTDFPMQDSLDMVPNGGAMPLLLHVAQNAAFLDYQVWLLGVHEDLETMPISIDDHSILRHRQKAVESVIEELEHLEMLKGSEWVRQYTLHGAARSHAQAGVPVVDIGELRVHYSLNASYS
jgi:hypothetical protein